MPTSGQKRTFEEGPLPEAKRNADYASCSSSESAGTREQQRAERHYIMRVDDKFDGDRYRVIKQLGKGTFGRVVEMWDEQEQRHVAVKVVRAVEKYSREAEIEAEILLKVQKDSAPDLPIGRLIRSFSSQGHCCLVFGKLGPSLYHALRGVKREAERRSRGKALHAGPTLLRVESFSSVCYDSPALARHTGTSLCAQVASSRLLRSRASHSTASRRSPTSTRSSWRTPTSSPRTSSSRRPAARTWPSMAKRVALPAAGLAAYGSRHPRAYARRPSALQRRAWAAWDPPCSCGASPRRRPACHFRSSPPPGGAPRAERRA